jgi:hypothetical protein
VLVRLKPRQAGLRRPSLLLMPRRQRELVLLQTTFDLTKLERPKSVAALSGRDRSALFGSGWRRMDCGAPTRAYATP